MNGITMAAEGFGAAAAAAGPVGAAGSGTRTAWPIRLLLLLLLQDPKHQYWLQQPPQRFFGASVGWTLDSAATMALAAAKTVSAVARL